MEHDVHKLTTSNFFANEVNIYLNVLGFLMLNMIVRQIHNSTYIIKIHLIGLRNSNKKLQKSTRETALAKLRYSALALERDKAACHFENQDNKRSPIKTQYAKVERRVSGHPAQLTLVYEPRVVVDKG